MERVTADGKHLRAGSLPFRVKGVTYGTFLPRDDGALYPEPRRLEEDLATIAELGFNTVRVYTPPPEDLLDCARSLGLRVLVGLHYPDWRMYDEVSRSVTREVRESGVRAARAAAELLGGRPEVLAVSVGNEVPADVVRTHGRHAVEATLSAIVAEVHAKAPDLLVTYTGFPTAEFLQVEGQDLITFNVFLEQAGQLRPYLRHLQRMAFDRPLVITEVGLAAAIHGDAQQANSLAMQLTQVDECGCAGATVFAWTDEWATGAGPVEGWGFGLTRADRTPRPSLAVAARWAGRAVPEMRARWPSISVVVCAFNEERHLADCLASLDSLDYPRLQVIVCDDGSSDATGRIAHATRFQVLDLPHGGLSVARNAGLAAAQGEIVAYLDADAFCHPEWPYHLALAFEDERVVAAGGPNLPVPDAGLVERAVSLSPGNAVEVLVGDDRAEHVPGCNLAVRRSALEAVGGFDPAYTAAGDDVDVCWRLLERGGAIAFSPAAQVYHHRRGTVGGYLRQQRGYGRAERMLSGPHRHRFNRLGAARWSGVVYGGARVLPRLFRPVVYHGPMGTALFQGQIRDRAAQVGGWANALVPVVTASALAALPLALVSPVVLVVPVTGLLLLAGYAVAVALAVRLPRGAPNPRRSRLLVGVLHLLQPLARTWGRISTRPLTERVREVEDWSGSRTEWLEALARDLAAHRCTVRQGTEHSTWDLSVSLGPMLLCRLRTAVLWEWSPICRVSLRVRAPALIMLALLLAVVPLAPVAAGLGFVALGTWATLEALFLRRRTAAAVLRTTRGVAR